MNRRSFLKALGGAGALIAVPVSLPLSYAERIRRINLAASAGTMKPMQALYGLYKIREEMAPTGDEEGLLKFKEIFKNCPAFSQGIEAYGECVTGTWEQVRNGEETEWQKFRKAKGLTAFYG